MKGFLIRLGAFNGLLVLANVITGAVVARNLSQGVYPTDADSIGIPIGMTQFYSLRFAPYLVALALWAFVPWQRISSVPAKAGVSAALLVAYAPAIAALVFAVLYWFGPNHYLISGWYGGFVLVVGAHLGKDMQSLFSNKALQSDVPRRWRGSGRA